MDAFHCSACGKVYTLEEVMDDVLDLASKPVSRPTGSTTTAPRPKMVPLSRTLQTYEVKEDLKALGAKWDHINRQWMVPEDRFAEAHQIVKNGPRRTTSPPTSAATFTFSKFAGLATDDGPSFEDIENMSWQDYNRMRHEQAQRQPAPAPRYDVRLCWECGKSFDKAPGAKGVWDDYWCGCEGR